MCCFLLRVFLFSFFFFPPFHPVPVQCCLRGELKCLSLEMEEGGRDRGRERRAAELIAPRHLFQPMLKNYSTVPPDTAFYPQKDHCQRLKINNRLPINTFPQISPDYKHIDDTSIGSLLMKIPLSLSPSLSVCLSHRILSRLIKKKKIQFNVIILIIGINFVIMFFCLLLLLQLLELFSLASLLLLLLLMVICVIIQIGVTDVYIN